MANHRKAYLEITNRCNLNCSFCPGTDRAPGRLDEQQFTFLAKRLSGWAEYLFFHLMGEPTAHPGLPRFIEIASELGMKSIITTNGTLLRSRGDSIIEANPHKISISLHAFEANPPGMSFDEYIDGCLEFAKKASASGIITVLRLWNLDGHSREAAHHEQNDSILAALHEAFPEEWTAHHNGYKIRDRVYLEWGERFDWPSMTDAPDYGDRKSVV